MILFKITNRIMSKYTYYSDINNILISYMLLFHYFIFSLVTMGTGSATLKNLGVQVNCNYKVTLYRNACILEL